METATATCQTFQTGVNKLAQWEATWRLQFEPSKSQAMTISRHRVDWPIPPVAFNGLNVADVDTIKLLGVTFDRHLHYGQHLRTTALRAARRIGFLRKACKVLDHKGRTAAYKGFVRPMLEYCPLVWSGAADGHLRRLDKVQKRALSLLGQGTIVDSLVLRRTVSGLSFLYKLLSGPRLPTLRALLPPQLAHIENPRTRRQLATAHPFQLSLSPCLCAPMTRSSGHSPTELSQPGTPFRFTSRRQRQHLPSFRLSRSKCTVTCWRQTGFGPLTLSNIKSILHTATPFSTWTTV